LHDPDARPIRKGRIHKAVEFGYKAQVADNDGGVIPGYSVEYGPRQPAAGARSAAHPPTHRARATGGHR
jgi:hypothetical protein